MRRKDLHQTTALTGVSHQRNSRTWQQVPASKANELVSKRKYVAEAEAEVKVEVKSVTIMGKHLPPFHNSKTTRYQSASIIGRLLIELDNKTNKIIFLCWSDSKG